MKSSHRRPSRGMGHDGFAGARQRFPAVVQFPAVVRPSSRAAQSRFREKIQTPAAAAAAVQIPTLSRAIHASSRR